MMRLTILFLLLTLSALTMANQMKVCEQCYQQKITLVGHCDVNPQLMRTEGPWCERQRMSAEQLKSKYRAFDRLIDKKTYFSFIIPANKFPYDACDACYNNIFSLYGLCIQRKLAKQPCKNIFKAAAHVANFIKQNLFIISEAIHEN